MLLTSWSGSVPRSDRLTAGPPDRRTAGPPDRRTAGPPEFGIFRRPWAGKPVDSGIVARPWAEKGATV